MSELQAFLGDRAIPELFNRLYGDAERLSGDIERLQRFVKLTMAEKKVAFVNSSVTDTSLDPYPLLSREEAKAWLGQPAISPHSKPAAPKSSAVAPIELGSSARQRLEADAHAAATQMVEHVNLMRQQKQSTATSLAYALRAAREASAGFECPRTMDAILTALDGMDAAAREEQSNG